MEISVGGSPSHNPKPVNAWRVGSGTRLKGINSSAADPAALGPPPATRVLAASTAIVCIAALVWAVFGSVPTRVIGRGVLLSDQEGNFSIASVGTGPVLEVLVKPGAPVIAGMPIAVIEQKLLTTQIENAVAEVERLEANLTLLKAANAAQNPLAATAHRTSWRRSTSRW